MEQNTLRESLLLGKHGLTHTVWRVETERFQQIRPKKSASTVKLRTARLWTCPKRKENLIYWAFLSEKNETNHLICWFNHLIIWFNSLKIKKKQIWWFNLNVAPAATKVSNWMHGNHSLPWYHRNGDVPGSLWTTLWPSPGGCPFFSAQILLRMSAQIFLDLRSDSCVFPQETVSLLHVLNTSHPWHTLFLI